MLQRHNKSRIFTIVHDSADRFGVRILRFTNVGNHLHILVIPGSRKGFQNFLRLVTGAIAFFVTGAKKGHGLRTRFWDMLAYTRVVSWGRDLKNLTLYFVKNLLEGLDISRGQYELKPLPE